jgi:hypothetical protein
MVMREAKDLSPTVSLDEERESDGAAARVLVKRVKRARGASAMLAAGAFALAGCAAGAGPAPTVRPLMVPVLHETPCPVPALADPALPLKGLGPESPAADTMRAYAAAVAILKGAVRERDAVLAGCARADRPAHAQAENVQ